LFIWFKNRKSPTLCALGEPAKGLVITRNNGGVKWQLKGGVCEGGARKGQLSMDVNEPEMF
jgi:hypothetical protein